MNMRFKKLTIKALSISALAIVIAGCGTDSDTPENNNTDTTKQIDQNKSQLLEIDGQLFSIPSPVQTALLIKEVGANFNGEMLNSPKNSTNYSTNFKKAVNLGVYGADLGYVTIYDQTQDAITYLTAIKTVGDELGVSSAFDLELVERFEKNIGNQDSLLSLVSDAYRASDRYLKNNEQNDIGGLILAGGWIESLYFATNAAKMTKNQEIIRRIGEQKNTLNNLIKLLTPYYSKPEFSELIDGLMEINEIFNNVEFTYTYVEPTTDENSRTTTINSTTEVKISDEQLQNITDKIEQLRNKIIG
ncbi:MAG: hypothetical protein Kow0079_12710 [Vicingaceae bacterium]